MKRTMLVHFLLTITICLSGQPAYRIETIDIDHFWEAYDQLPEANTEADSIATIQRVYLDRATDNLKLYVEKRHFTAPWYVKNLRAYPKFWRSVRPLTEAIADRKAAIDSVFLALDNGLPDFRQPDVCFAIGCLNSGGTIDDGLILIGAEIAASDETVDKSEMTGWLAAVIGGDSDIVNMVAHETVHTQQRNVKRFTLITGTMQEGVADFISGELTGRKINRELFAYGDENFCALRREFLADLEKDPKSYKNWIYQGNAAKDRPADLGYYLGARIAGRWYHQQADKQKALTRLLNHKQYKKIFRESGFGVGECWVEAID